MQDNSDKYCVVSRARTGSTLLVNIVLGFFDPEAPVKFWPANDNSNFTVLKTHDFSVLNHEDINVIGSQRRQTGALIPLQDYGSPRILIIDFNDIVYKSPYSPEAEKSLSEAVEFVAEKIQNHFSATVNAKQVFNAIERIEKMNDLYETIKHKPFSYFDPFFHIHGSHRLRGKG